MPPVVDPLPPSRLETDRLVIRRYEVADAELTQEAAAASLADLKPWMPWAENEPEPIEAKRELLDRFRTNFLAGEDFIYGVFNRDETRQVGGTGLHFRVGPQAAEIGYWTRTGETGKGNATEMAAVLTRVGIEYLGLDRTELRVEPGNVASLAIPPKLGYEREALLKRRFVGWGGELKDVVVFSMFAGAYAGSGAAGLAGRLGLRGWDEGGGVVVGAR